MNGTKKRMGGLAVAALLAACVGPGSRSGEGEAYRVGGDPWAEPQAAAEPKVAKQDGGANAPAAAAKTGETPVVGGAPAAGTVTPPIERPIEGTALEQLDAALTRNQQLEKDNQSLTAQVASLNAVVEQLRRDNAGLAQLVQANAESQAGITGEVDKLRATVKDFELRARQLADDLLSERIKRVRVERQLILAKVAEAESQGDG
ncbi:MAG: hypothetical protein JNL90_04225 [Planctomycetes bacterium]|nr:hypothetical protein [Planctomycetota bacterium]